MSEINIFDKINNVIEFINDKNNYGKHLKLFKCTQLDRKYKKIFKPYINIVSLKIVPIDKKKINIIFHIQGICGIETFIKIVYGINREYINIIRYYLYKIFMIFIKHKDIQFPYIIDSIEYRYYNLLYFENKRDLTNVLTINVSKGYCKYYILLDTIKWLI